MTENVRQQTRLIDLHDGHRYIGQFFAMGAQCQVLMSGGNLRQANQCLNIVSAEAWRIQNKYSRFSSGNMTAEINRSQGLTIVVDRETVHLLASLDRLHLMTEGRFDASAGRLRDIWHFEAGSSIPMQSDIDRLLEYIGWSRVLMDECSVHLPGGMALDFDAVARSYAVDRCLELAVLTEVEAILINLGGDVASNRAQAEGEPWQVAIASADQSHTGGLPILLEVGGVATRGDAARFIEVSGKRYGAVLDARSGWPLSDTPASVSTRASNCEQAGFYATVALYRPGGVSPPLQNEHVNYWIHQ